MKIITHQLYNKALYSLSHPFAAFNPHPQSCSPLYSLIFVQKSTGSYVPG